MIVKILVLLNKEILISEIEEVGADIGEPDCKLVNPFLLSPNGNNELSIVPWIFEYSSEKTFMINSDKILTIAEPTPAILEKYKELTK
jgi:hypothetical protein